MRNIVIPLLVMALLAAGVGYMVLRPGPQAQSSAAPDLAFSFVESTSTLATATSTGPRPVPDKCGQVSTTSTCVEYRSEKYHFSVFYPSMRDIKEYDEGQGAGTIVFQNVQLVRGFQVFIVPYSQPQVTQERFLKDEPSGERTDVQNVSVGGVNGASFYSKDAVLGGVFEVWFIHGGYLYEITTLKGNESRLLERLQTWQFI